MCLDLLKGTSDDFSYTEDHIAYLLDKFRALLLKQRYGNDPKKHVPYSNYQNIDLTLTLGTPYYISNDIIPAMLQIGIPRITSDGYYNIKFEYISRERLPFVGYNKYLKNIRYCGINEINRLCVVPKEDDDFATFNYLRLTAIFENPRSIQTNSTTHWMDNQFPLEEPLIPNLIELVVNSLVKSVNSPTDTINNGADDYSSIPTTTTKKDV
jgi:hypothetical protein